MSVADRGRGGFDSHTFPPSRRGRVVRSLALTAWLALAAGPGLASAAVAAPADSTGAAFSDSAAVVDPGVAPSPRPRLNARGELLRPWHQAPWAIMTRSGLVPGWGQWTNGRPWKALLVAGAEVAGGWRLAAAMAATNDALARERAALLAGDEAAADQARAEYGEAFNRRATWAWIVGTAVAASMLDAYVDAHLLQFDADFGPDPKLFDEDDAARNRASGGGADVMVGFRITFQGPAGR